MRDLDIGRLVRALRRRRGWRQEDCSRRAGVHRSTWSNLERGFLDRMNVAALRGCLAVLGVSLDFLPRWRGSELDRLLDEGHAALQAAWKERLEAWGWLVRAEVSFNRYGERGRVDLLAWYAPLRILLVVEIKTEIVDVQSLLGGLDTKARVAPYIARDLGFGTPRLVVSALIVRDGSTNRDRVRRVAPLFAAFALRGRRAVSWMHRPSIPAAGVLVFSDLRPANGGHVKSVGSHRVRSAATQPSVHRARAGASDGARAT